MYPWWLLPVVEASVPLCSIQAKDGRRRERVAHQFFDCAQAVPSGFATFATQAGTGSPTGVEPDNCWYQRIPLLDLDPDVVTGEANISILAVVTGGACGGPKALGFTAGTAVRDYFVQGTADATPDQWHFISPYFESLGTHVPATAFHMGGAEHSDNGFILAGPRLERVDEGGQGFSADGVGTFASFYRGPEAA